MNKLGSAKNSVLPTDLIRHY